MAEADVIVTGAKIYSSPVATALPAVTVAVDGAWPAGWVYVGYTLEPLKLTYNFDALEIMVQQTLNPIARTRIKEEAMFETVLAEHFAANLALAMAGTSSTTNAVSGTPGYEDFYVGGDYNLPVKQWGFEGSYVSAAGNRHPIRVFIWRGNAQEGGELDYDRENPAGIPLKIKALADTGKTIGQHLMRIQRVTAPALP